MEGEATLLPGLAISINGGAEADNALLYGFPHPSSDSESIPSRWLIRRGFLIASLPII